MKNKIYIVSSSIFGVAIILNNSYLEMEKDFIIKENNCGLNSEIIIGKKNIVNEKIYSNSSIINIKGGIIEEEKNIVNCKKAINSE